LDLIMPISVHLSMSASRIVGDLCRCASKLSAIAAVGSLMVIALGGVGRSAYAQGVFIAVVPPPPFRELPDPKSSADDGQPVKFTQAKQQFVNPERAYDPNTGQSLRWDCVKKTWIDAKTDKAVGFQGGKARDGEVIPPPPRLELADSERVTNEGLVARLTQATQDPDNPERAYDATSGKLLAWDRGQKTWIEAKTGEAVGFLGRKGPSSCPQPIPAATQATLPTATVSPARGRELMFNDPVGVGPSDGDFPPAPIGQSHLQMELIFTSKPSLIGGGLQFVHQSTQQAAAISSFGASAFVCSGCSGDNACPFCPESPVTRRTSRTAAATLIAQRSRMR
jgi:hypothetical protein